jgi:hypothetical protein
MIKNIYDDAGEEQLLDSKRDNICTRPDQQTDEDAEI